jgi:molecular chaperone DnaJ
MGRDYYAVLGVEPTATIREIRQAYRQLARQYSPDVNLWDEEARSLYEEISEAYRVLSNATARSLYDRYGHRAFGGEGAQAADQPQRPGAVRGEDIHYFLDLAFADAARGVSLALEISRLSPCAACEASGTRRDAPLVACDHCGGTGRVWRLGGGLHAESCPACEGLGRRVADPCPHCAGRGVSPKFATVPVAVPPGVDTGTQITLPGEGHSGPYGGPRGDLTVITRVASHPFFVRKGDNLHCEIPVTLTEAVLGARIQVPTLDGWATLVLPSGVQNGQVFRLRGKGLPRLDSDRCGDLYVTATILIPRGLDARTQQIFRDLERLIPEDPRAGLFATFVVAGVAPSEDRR